MAWTKNGRMKEAKARRKEAAAQRAEARADRATAKAERNRAKNKAKAERERHDNELRRQHRPTHGFSVGVWRRRPKKVKKPKDRRPSKKKK